jgi:hypothetical protein
MIKLTPLKPIVIPYKDPKDPEIDFSITWVFPLSTLPEMEEIRKSFTDEDTDGTRLDKVWVSSIKEQAGFVDEEGKPLDVTNEIHRAAIYDFIKGFPEYRTLVLAAYLGPRAKNLLAGAMPVSTGSGDQENAAPAS